MRILLILLLTLTQCARHTDTAFCVIDTATPSHLTTQHSTLQERVLPWPERYSWLTGRALTD
jgi:tRNA uridine 5-carbamoylmethylation protein Kti12